MSAGAYYIALDTHGVWHVSDGEAQAGARLDGLDEEAA